MKSLSKNIRFSDRVDSFGAREHSWEKGKNKKDVSAVKEICYRVPRYPNVFPWISCNQFRKHRGAFNWWMGLYAAGHSPCANPWRFVFIFFRRFLHRIFIASLSLSLSLSLSAFVRLRIFGNLTSESCTDFIFRRKLESTMIFSQSTFIIFLSAYIRAQFYAR